MEEQSQPLPPPRVDGARPWTGAMNCLCTIIQVGEGELGLAAGCKDSASTNEG